MTNKRKKGKGARQIARRHVDPAGVGKAMQDFENRVIDTMAARGTRQARPLQTNSALYTALSTYLQGPAHNKPTKLLRDTLGYLSTESWTASACRYDTNKTMSFTALLQQLVQARRLLHVNYAVDLHQVDKREEESFGAKLLNRAEEALIREGLRRTTAALQTAVADSLLDFAPEGQIVEIAAAVLRSPAGQAILAGALSLVVDKIPLNKLPFVPKDVGLLLDQHKALVVDELQAAGAQVVAGLLFNVAGAAFSKIGEQLPTFFSPAGTTRQISSASTTTTTPAASTTTTTPTAQPTEPAKTPTVVDTTIETTTTTDTNSSCNGSASPPAR